MGLRIQGNLPKQDAFGDAGVLLAGCLLRELDECDEGIAIPESPIRATVIGAGAHSLQLSGSTVYVSDHILPLRNLPIMPLESGVAGDETKGPVALMIGNIEPMGYAELKQFAQKLAASFRDSKARPPFTLLMQQDMGAALGQLLRAELPDSDLIVLDGIGVDTGDCIDIGKPMSGGQFVPVVIKEFVFASQFEPEVV
jgi:ethanolamine utilization protein EutA